MNTLAGCDISHDQGQINWEVFKNNINFVFMQASYGVGNFDAMYGYNKGQVLQTNLPHGYYHFAYPNLNAALDEAKWFVQALKAIRPLQPGEIIFLDYEEQASDGDNVTWVKTFLDYVYAQTGVKPILYTYQDMLTENDFTSVSDEGYGLWIAAPTNDPSNNNFKTGSFPFALAQQWGTETIPGVNAVTDADIFFGTVEELQAYGYQPPIPAAPIQTAPPVSPTVPVQPVSTSTPTVPAPTSPTSPTSPTTPPVSTPPAPVETPPVATQPTSNNPNVTPADLNFLKWLYAFFLGNI